MEGTSLFQNTNRPGMFMALLLSASCAAAQPPDFSGAWKLNLARSGPAMPHGLEAITLVVNQRGNAMNTEETRTVSGKTTTGTTDSSIDGTDHAANDAQGRPVHEKRWWSGDTLMIHWERKEGTTTWRSDIRQKLSADGKVMRMLEHYREPGIDRIREWFFEKQ